MTQPANEGSEPKTRKPRVAKSPKPQDVKSKVKISAYISLESARRLGIHATMTDQDTIGKDFQKGTVTVTPGGN